MRMLHEGQKPILWVNIAAIALFSAVFAAQENIEFIFYIAVILFFLGVVLYSNRFVRYPNFVLWGLTLWAILHMLGGTEFADGRVVYTYVLFPLVGDPYSILKYDQVVHALGFFVATLVMYYALVPHLREMFSRRAVIIVVVLAGLGLGALNEIIEFSLTVLLPNTNVGGYENTALDLVADALGAVAAGWFVYARKKEEAGVRKQEVGSRHESRPGEI